MFSFRKFWFTLGSYLMASQMFTYRSSAHLCFLVGIQSLSHQNASPRPSIRFNGEFVVYLISRFVLYSIITVYMLNGLYVVHLLISGAPLLLVDPLMALVIGNYKSFSPLPIASQSLMGIYAIYIDWILSFNMDAYLTSLLHELVCINPDAFFFHNTHLPKVPSIVGFLLHPIENVLKVRFLMTQLWNPSRHLTVSPPPLVIFPFLSLRIRSRLAQLTLFYEHAFAGLAVALGNLLPNMPKKLFSNQVILFPYI